MRNFIASISILVIAAGCSGGRDTGPHDGGGPPPDGQVVDGRLDVFDALAPPDGHLPDGFVPPDAPVITIDGGTTTCVEGTPTYACEAAMCGNGAVETCPHCR